MIKKLQFISVVLIALLSVISVSKADINVVTSIKPLHSLASYVMNGVSKPDVIVDGYNSPHGFSLKPSHAKMIEKADLIIWVGEDLEAFLEKPLNTIAKKAINIEIMDLKEIKKLKFREKNTFESHDDHGHGHKKEKHDDHGHDHKKEKHDDHGHKGHAHGEFDPHIWLDPMNAKVIIKEIEKQLKKLDPENSIKYSENSKKAQSELDSLTKKIKKDLEGNLRFVVFHDAYQYFENRFDIKVLGALTVNPDVLPGAEQLSEIREVIEHKKVNCLFAEPQFNPAIIKSIAKDTKVKTGVLDPLGATLNPGKSLYFDLIRNMSKSFKGC